VGRPFQGDLRAVLVAEARRRLASSPAEGISLRELAQAVGVSHVAVYGHFSNLDAIFAVIAAEDFAEVESLLRMAISMARTEDDALTQAGQAYVAFAMMNPHRFRSMYRRLGAGDETVRVPAAQLFGVLTGTIAHGQSTGRIVEGDPAIVATCALAAAHGLAALAIDGALPPEAANPVALSATIAAMLRRS